MYIHNIFKNYQHRRLALNIMDARPLSITSITTSTLKKKNFDCVCLGHLFRIRVTKEWRLGLYPIILPSPLLCLLYHVKIS